MIEWKCIWRITDFLIIIIIIKPLSTSSQKYPSSVTVISLKEYAENLLRYFNSNHLNHIPITPPHRMSFSIFLLDIVVIKTCKLCLHTVIVVFPLTNIFLAFSRFMFQQILGHFYLFNFFIFFFNERFVIQISRLQMSASQQKNSLQPT